MKRIFTLLILFFLISNYGFGQKLTLTNLTNLCNKKNWEDVNQTLLAKNWIYYDSEKGNTYQYNTITWSYKKDYYNDKAKAWFYLYTYEGLPNKISYTVINKESYSIIQNSIATAGFKLTNSAIEDNEIVSTYSNASYTLKISTEKRSESDYSWESSSFTAYNILLIKKAGIYDLDNGNKIDYYDNNEVFAEYTLLNGKINGQLKVYYEDGTLKKIGTYSNGIENGLFKEYDEYGDIEYEYNMSYGELSGSFKTYYTNGKISKSGFNLKGKEHGNIIEYDEYGVKVAEYEMANGKKNGILKIYEDGEISVSSNWIDDIENGQHIEYYYNEETGKLHLKEISEYLNDQKNGIFKLILLYDSKERLLTFSNYKRDKKHGAFQEIEGDSIIIGSYINDKLEGAYKIFLDVNRILIGGIIETDTSMLTLLTEGSYRDGVKIGYWKYYDFTSSLRNEGEYTNGLKTGEWKSYHTTWADDEDGVLPYSKELYLVENYSNDKLNGKSTRYSFLEEKKFPCSELSDDGNPLDTCTQTSYHKIFETSFYKDDVLHGPYELRDSANAIVSKGLFKDDLKEEEWVHRYKQNDINNDVFYFYQKGNYIKDTREGKWIEYYKESDVTQTFNYRKGILHGEFIVWNNNGKPREIKQFNFEKLTELVTYDSIGVKPLNKYEIYQESNTSFKCRHTQYLENGYAFQEYLVNKDQEIPHELFEIIFSVAVGKLSDGSSGYMDGEFKFFDYKDQPIVTGKMYKKDKIGLWTYYYYDQNLKMETNYTNNIPTDEKYLQLNGQPYSGDFVYYDNDNRVKEERKIKDSLRNGKTTYIDLNTNKTIKKENYKNGILN